VTGARRRRVFLRLKPPLNFSIIFVAVFFGFATFLRSRSRAAPSDRRCNAIGTFIIWKRFTL